MHTIESPTPRTFNSSSRDPYILASAAGGPVVDDMTRGQRLIKNSPKEAIVEHIVLTPTLSSPDPHVPCPLAGCQREAHYELQLAASALDTRRRRGRRIALTATRGNLGEVGGGER